MVLESGFGSRAVAVAVWESWYGSFGKEFAVWELQYGIYGMGVVGRALLGGHCITATSNAGYDF